MCMRNNGKTPAYGRQVFFAFLTYFIIRKYAIIIESTCE